MPVNTAMVDTTMANTVMVHTVMVHRMCPREVDSRGCAFTGIDLDMLGVYSVRNDRIAALAARELQDGPVTLNALLEMTHVASVRP
jgi:hypothetical protein